MERDDARGTSIQVELRADADARDEKWYVLGRWASGDADFHRTSVPGQGDKDGSVAIDTFVPKEGDARTSSALTLYRGTGRRDAAPDAIGRSVVANDAAPYTPSATTMTR